MQNLKWDHSASRDYFVGFDLGTMPCTMPDAMPIILPDQSRRLRYGSGGGKSCRLFPTISNMAGPIWVKLSGMIADSAENDLAKE